MVKTLSVCRPPQGDELEVHLVHMDYGEGVGVDMDYGEGVGVHMDYSGRGGVGA